MSAAEKSFSLAVRLTGALPISTPLPSFTLRLVLHRFLYIQKNNVEAARAALQRLRGTEHVQDELDQMKKEKVKDQTSTTETYTFAMLFGDKANHLPLIATIAMQVLQQWSGINAIMFYSALIFQDAGTFRVCACACFSATVCVFLCLSRERFVYFACQCMITTGVRKLKTF